MELGNVSRRGTIKSAIFAPLATVAAICALFLPALYHGKIASHSLTREEMLHWLNLALLNNALAAGVSLASLMLCLVILWFLGPDLINLRTSTWSSVLLLPILLGDASLSFIYRELFANTRIIGSIAQSSLETYFSLILGRIWQMAPFILFALLLKLQEVPESKLEFSKHMGMTRSEHFSLVTVPFIRPTAILLASIVFMLSLQASAVLKLVFKVSPGTGTELLNNWLTRVFHVKLVADPIMAGGWAMKVGIATSVVNLVSAIVFLLVCSLSFSLLEKIIGYIGGSSKPKNYTALKRRSSRLVLSAFVLFSLVPALFPVFTAPALPKFEASALARTFLMVVLAAGAGVVICILISLVAAPRFWPAMKLRSYQPSELLTKPPSYVILAILWAPLLVPGTPLLLAIYDVLAILGYERDMILVTAWTAGHILLVAPIIVAFVAVSHSAVSNSHSHFFRLAQATRVETLWFGYIRRFAMIYVISALFIFSIIWNEPVLNRSLSAAVPSFVSKLELSMSGRSGSVALAKGYYWISIVAAASCLLAWRAAVKKLVRG